MGSQFLSIIYFFIYLFIYYFIVQKIEWDTSSFKICDFVSPFM
jgi:hypothetical protein